MIAITSRRLQALTVANRQHVHRGKLAFFVSLFSPPLCILFIDERAVAEARVGSHRGNQALRGSGANKDHFQIKLNEVDVQINPARLHEN